METEKLSLEALRHELQECDLKLLMMLQERFRLTARLGMEKQRQQIDPHQEVAWQRKILFLGSHLEGDRHAEAILKVFHTIHHESVEAQRQLSERQKQP
jgi:chorismate mutase